MTAKKTPAKKAPAKRAAGATSRRTSKAAGPAKKTAAKKAPAKKTPTKKAAAAKTATPPRRRGRKPKPDPRLLKVLELRRDGKSWLEISAELKYPGADAAFRAFEQAMQMYEVTSVANQRILERERLDHLHSVLWPTAAEGDPKALDQLLDVIDQRMKIPPPLDNRPGRELGPNEKATAKETEKLARHAPALAAAAQMLARALDDNAGDPDKVSAIARELRISMTQLRGLAGTRVEEEDPDTPRSDKSVVVPPSRLEELRHEVDSGTRTS